MGEVVGRLVVGDTDGDAVGVEYAGKFVGATDGVLVEGVSVGEMVGEETVGDKDGEKVGFEVVGEVVGDRDGVEVDGERVGLVVGVDSVGDIDGDVVGEEVVGEVVGDVVGLDDVGDVVGDSVCCEQSPEEVSNKAFFSKVVVTCPVRHVLSDESQPQLKSTESPLPLPGSLSKYTVRGPSQSNEQVMVKHGSVVGD